MLGAGCFRNSRFGHDSGLINMHCRELRWLSLGLLSLTLLICPPSVSAVDSLPWEESNPIIPIPDPPLGVVDYTIDVEKLTELENPPTPESVRLGRWLFFDKRLSADNTISCASNCRCRYVTSANS